MLKLTVLLLLFSYHIKENCPLYPMLKLCGPLLFSFHFYLFIFLGEKEI